MSSRLNVDQSVDINNPTISLSVKKVGADNLPKAVYQGLSKIGLPSFCDMIAEEPKNDTNATNNPLYTPPKDPNSCDSKTVVMRSKNEPLAPTGINGANETKIQDSSTVGVEFLDENSNPIKISNSKQPIDVWIPKNPTLNVEFTNVNISNLTLIPDSPFLPNGITVDAVNISVFFQIEPFSRDIGYMLWYKLGLTPVLNDTSLGFCPQSKSNIQRIN